MIRSVRIRGFKRFRDAEFHFPGHATLTGPNDTGKTTLLQAIASWALALRRWRELGDFRHRNGYRSAPIARQAFVTVPLRSFDLLWPDRRYRGTIEIELRHDAGWSVTMVFIPDTTEQIYVRPRHDAPADTLREIDLDAVFIPPMTGVRLSEPLLMPPKIEQSLCLGRPGDVLRNLLADTFWNESAWDALQATIGKLFGYRLLRPDTDVADIQADYVRAGPEVPIDITFAGGGIPTGAPAAGAAQHPPRCRAVAGQPGHPPASDPAGFHLPRTEEHGGPLRLTAHRRHPLRCAHQRHRAARTDCDRGLTATATGIRSASWDVTGACRNRRLDAGLRLLSNAAKEPLACPPRKRLARSRRGLPAQGHRRVLYGCG